MNFTGFENIDRTYFKVDGTAFAGISGGRTSGLMAALLDSNVQLLFENTGREKEETYIFVEELSQSLGRRITWLEYRKPPNKGDAPKYAGVAVVDFATANRKGQPFIDFMSTLAEYRALVESFEGNCDGCFLKDQADLSRMLGRMQDPEFWFRMEEAYKWFGGRDFVGYRQVWKRSVRLTLTERHSMLATEVNTWAQTLRHVKKSFLKSHCGVTNRKDTKENATLITSMKSTKWIARSAEI